MNKFMIACVAALSLFTVAGCKKKGGGADAVAKFEGWKNDMCKCKAGDAACANKILDEQKKWGEEQAKTADKDAKPDPEITKKMEPIMAEYTKCMTAAMTPAAAGGGAMGGGSAEPPKDEPKKDEPAKEEPKKDEPAGSDKK